MHFHQITFTDHTFVFLQTCRHIYRKWNERLYQELLLAYKKGRSEVDPSENWYKGEIGFFDFYIIPLAKKLKNCGVFGVSCDEYLNYAQTNRAQWVQKGPEIVAAMIQKYRDIDQPQAVKLGNIQDSDGSALRSSLLSSETEHGSSHVTRAMHENLLDMDTMSVDTSPSFAVSMAKSHDGNKSGEGNRSCASETIFEGEEEDWENADDVNLDEEDDFYSESGSSESDSSDSSDFSIPSGDSPQKAQPDASTDKDNDDSHINKLITTGASRPLRGSASKSVKQSSTQGGDRDKKDKARAPLPTKADDDWGQKSGDSFCCDLNEIDSTPLNNNLQKFLPDDNKSKIQDIPGVKTPNVTPQMHSLANKKAFRGQSDTACSTTVVSTEWGKESVESRYPEPINDMEGMDLYCLQQRINSRLVGNSIRNSRAYDKKPPLEEMGFF